MKKILYTIIILGALLLSSGCEDYLNINRNPNSPEKVTAYLYLGPMEQWIALAMQWDARMIGYYNQNFANYSASTVGYDAQGTPAWTSDMAQHWYAVYWKMGINLSEMISISENEQRWDLAGIGYVLRAWGWQMLTDMHGPIILKEAFQPGLYAFNYDNENLVYEEVIKLCNKAIENLNRGDGSTSSVFAGKGDQIFAGDRVKWKRFAYGLKALSMSHLSNKTALYNPDGIISAVDSSLTGNNDNVYVKFNGSISDDASFFGPMRGNFLAARASKFIVSLMDGTALGTILDPRIKVMLPPSVNTLAGGTTWVGVTPTVGYTSIPANDRPYNLYGLNSVAAAPALTVGMYIFTNNVKWPLMTYSELQFIKAEAAFRKPDKTLARTAYDLGVKAAIDFTNLYVGTTSYGTVPAITTTDKNNFVASAVPADPNLLTMSMIMGQKYVHLWGWGFMETWSDMRRYHYIDTYPGETAQVYKGLILPPLAAENNGKVIYRIRPRYNSEYVWNMAALKVIGADLLDYHTKEIWIAKPE
jgi:hypothetical protein